MKLVVGLGNPGKKYANTRHNLGFMALDALQKTKYKIPNIKYLKPSEGMNISGKEVKRVVDQYKIDLDDLYIIFDDLDIPLGKYKIVKASGPKDHNGVNSVYDYLGSRDFWHIRVGIENRPSESEGKPKISGEVYTLLPFDLEEEKIKNQMIEEIIKKICLVLQK